MRRALLLLLLTYLCSGCAGQLRSPAQGGKAVSRVNSAHFVVYSDESAQRAKELAQHLERVYYVLEHVAFPYTPHMKRTTQVVEFSDWKNLSVLDQGKRNGFYSDSWEPLSGAGLSVVAGQNPDAALTTAIHELVHSFVAHHLPNAPIWLNEGLAQYYSSLEFHGDDVVVGYHLLRRLNEGEANRIYYLDVQDGEQLTLGQLKNMTPGQFYAEAQTSYPSAWSTVCALQSSPYRPNFNLYLDALQSGKVSSALAFEKHLASFVNPEFDREQHKVLFEGALELRTIPLLKTVSAKLTPPSTLTDAQTLSLYARTAQGEQALGLAQEAVKLPGAGAEEWATLGLLEARSGQIPGAQVLASLEQAYQLAAPNEKTHYAAVLLQVMRSSNKLTIKKLDAWALQVMRQAQTPQARESVASYLLWRGRSRVAEREIQRSLKLDPARPSAWSVLARVMAAQRKYKQAAKYQALAVNLWGHSATPDSRSLLKSYQKKGASG